MNCKDFREIADSYLSNELLVETNHRILRHLENCSDCRAELAARRNLRETLREAVRRASQSRVDPAFASNLTRELRERALARKGNRSFAGLFGGNPALVSVLAVLTIAVGLGLIWNLRRPENAPLSANVNPSPTAGTNINAAEKSSGPAHRAALVAMEKDAVGDHKDCALKFSLKEIPISLDAAAEKYGAFNKDLDKTIVAPLKAAYGDQVKFLEAHSCIINGRRFAHVVLKYRARVISVLVTRRETESEPESPDAISCQPAGELRVACFQTAKFGVFVVSDLDETENLKLARTFSPAVKKHFERTETRA